MVLSALFIMDTKGKVIISRNYRGDIPMSVSDKFSLMIQEKEEVGYFACGDACDAVL
jgi:AP-1 complex subunit mu